MLLLGIATLAHARTQLSPVDEFARQTSPYSSVISDLTTVEDMNERPSEKVIRRAPNGMFYVSAAVNNQSVRFLIDTGATTIVLTSADAAAIGLDIGANDRTHLIRTAGGDARVAKVRLDSVNLGERKLKGLEAVVIDDGIGVSLLGQNALSQLNAMSIEGDRLTLR